MSLRISLSRKKVTARLAASAVGLSLALGLALPAAAAFPERAITLVYPYAAGSITEVAWRAIADRVSKILGQPVIVENRVGAGGRMGAEQAMGARPDGYTIGVFNNGIAVIQPLGDRAMTITPGKEYLPVVNAFETYQLFIGRKNLPFKDVAGMLAYAKANPGKLTISVAGLGTQSQINVELLKDIGGLDIITVPYNGQAPATTAVVTGEVDVGVSDASSVPFISSGQVIAISTSGPQRWSIAPNVPTMVEGGLKTYVTSVFQGVIAPPGTPPDVIATLNKAFNEALASEEVKQKLAAGGLQIIGGTAESFMQRIVNETSQFRPLFESGRVKVN